MPSLLKSIIRTHCSFHSPSKDMLETMLEDGLRWYASHCWSLTIFLHCLVYGLLVWTLIWEKRSSSIWSHSNRCWDFIPEWLHCPLLGFLCRGTGKALSPEKAEKVLWITVRPSLMSWHQTQSDWKALWHGPGTPSKFKCALWIYREGPEFRSPPAL